MRPARASEEKEIHMGTYNLTKGDTRPAAMDYGQIFVARIPIVVTEIIAANATLTANAKITAADVIQIWDVPPLSLIHISEPTRPY